MNTAKWLIVGIIIFGGMFFQVVLMISARFRLNTVNNDYDKKTFLLKTGPILLTVGLLFCFLKIWRINITEINAVVIALLIQSLISFLVHEILFSRPVYKINLLSTEKKLIDIIRDDRISKNGRIDRIIVQHDMFTVDESKAFIRRQHIEVINKDDHLMMQMIEDYKNQYRIIITVPEDTKTIKESFDVRSFSIKYDANQVTFFFDY